MSFITRLADGFRGALSTRTNIVVGEPSVGSVPKPLDFMIFESVFEKDCGTISADGADDRVNNMTITFIIPCDNGDYISLPGLVVDANLIEKFESMQPGQAFRILNSNTIGGMTTIGKIDVMDTIYRLPDLDMGREVLSGTRTTALSLN